MRRALDQEDDETLLRVGHQAVTDPLLPAMDRCIYHTYLCNAGNAEEHLLAALRVVQVIRTFLDQHFIHYMDQYRQLFQSQQDSNEHDAHDHSAALHADYQGCDARLSELESTINGYRGELADNEGDKKEEGNEVDAQG